MPLINETFESLPAIDPPLSPDIHNKISSSLLSSLPPSAATTLHPSLPPPYEPVFPPLFAADLSRLASSAPKPPGTGIDDSRYASPSAPADAKGASQETWNPILASAATSHAHLRLKAHHLQLLETHGKNAWLVGNWQMEAILGSLERELEVVQGEEKKVGEERKSAQEGVAGEMEILEESWRKGVGRTLEAAAAAEEVRRRVLGERRAAARGGAGEERGGGGEERGGLGGGGLTWGRATTGYVEDRGQGGVVLLDNDGEGR